MWHKKSNLLTAAVLAVAVLCSCGKMTLKVNAPVPKPNNDDFVVKAYIENSGSMNGYMCGGSELKDAVYSYLTALNGIASAVKINYVNSQVIPLRTPLSSLVAALNPKAFDEAGGNTLNSDFKQILADVIGRTDESTVSVLVSDCILDIPQESASDFLNITQTDINNIVTEKLKKMPTLSVCIYRLESKFQGVYYYPNGGCTRYSGKRPYFMWVIGSQKNLAHIHRNVPDSKIQHGVKNYCAFTPTANVPASIVQNGRNVQESQLNTTTRDGRRACQIKADMSLTLLTDDYLTDASNYIKTPDVTIQSVGQLPITDDCSHLLGVSVADRAFSEFITLKTAGSPSWLEAANGSKGSGIEAGKTFSIKHIIGGVADAYSKYAEAARITLTASKR